jgi:hypothetical protein
VLVVATMVLGGAASAGQRLPDVDHGTATCRQTRQRPIPRPPPSRITCGEKTMSRGGRVMLAVPLDTLMRPSSRPFFSYLASRLTTWPEAEKMADARQSA